MTSTQRPFASTNMIAEFRASPREGLFYLLFALMLLGIGLLLVVWATIEVFNFAAPKRHAPTDYLPAFGVAFLLAVPGFLLVRGACRVWRVRIRVFDDRITEIAHGRETWLFWDEIFEVRHVVNNGSWTTPLVHGGRRVRITASNGRELVLSGNLTGIRRLLSLIEEHTLALLLSESLETYMNEGQFCFGPIRLDAQGVHTKKAAISWDAHPSVKSGRFFVDVAGRNGKCRLRSAVDEVPNIHVLTAMVSKLTATMNE